MNKTDRKIFTKDINKIKWDYSLKKDNINIKPYKDDLREFSEIEFITVKLKNPDKTNHIAEIIMRTIPYPMVLCFENPVKYVYLLAITELIRQIVVKIQLTSLFSQIG